MKHPMICVVILLLITSECLQASYLANCGVEYCRQCSDTNTSICADCYYTSHLVGNQCLPCRDGCSICNPDNDCLVCNWSWYEEEDGTCTKCPGGCHECDGPSSCHGCISGHYLNPQSGVCQDCPENCEECSDSSTCTDCQDEFYVGRDGQCHACGVHCQECTNGNRCTRCMDAYYVTQGGGCRACRTGCASCWDKSTCNWCELGYKEELSMGRCRACRAGNCEECSDNVRLCGRCRPGYSLEGGSCRACPPTCDSCFTQPRDGARICETCKSGHYLNSGQCQACPVADCAECDEGATCSKCADRFYADPTTRECTACSSNCQICFDVNKCSQCDSGYFVNGNVCQVCSENCQDCTDSSGCLTCDDGYYLGSEGRCHVCSSDCARCHGETICRVCGDGSILISGACYEPSSERSRRLQDLLLDLDSY